MSSDNKRINTSTAAELVACMKKVDIFQLLISTAAILGVYRLWFDLSVKAFQTACDLTDLWFDEDDEEYEDEDDEEKN